MKASLLISRSECWGTTSRHPFGVLRLESSKLPQARLLVICMGRNDGASGGKRRRSNRSSKPKVRGPTPEDGLWYERDEQAVSTSGLSSSSPNRVQSQSTPGSSWERAGSLSTRGNNARQDNRRKRRDGDSDDDEDTRGWWERPEERSLQAFAAPALEPWQEERLQLAYAEGRRKAHIQELARELDLDRSVVIGWFKEFALRPQEERDAILTARRGEAAAKRAVQASKDAVEAATGQAAADARIAAAARPDQETPTGFVPFYLRKQLGIDKQKRISGEVLRTLESVYDRTPFPSGDVIRGLFELHRLSREVALEWFAARRAADGITSSTQKRSARESQRQKDRNIDEAFDGPEGGSTVGTPSGPESPGMLSLLGGLANGAQASGQPQALPEPTVVTLSRREMAALRSSLPSPTKHKGRQMAEKMGIKTGPDSETTQIGNVQYVADSPSPAERGDQMRASWRFRAATATGPDTTGMRRLRLKGRSAGG